MPAHPTASIRAAHSCLGVGGGCRYLNAGDNESFPRCLAFGGELYQFTPRKTTNTGVFGFSISPDMQVPGTAAAVSNEQ